MKRQSPLPKIRQLKGNLIMVFSTSIFIYLFLPITLLIYYITPKKGKNLIILLSGLLFYSWGEPIYVIVMLISTMIDYFAGLVMNHFEGKKLPRRICLIVSVVMNLGLLGVFKYSGFIAENINAIAGSQIIDINNMNFFGIDFLPMNMLPIGISFFTFQSMSYTIDLYMGNVKVQKNPISFAAFVTLFPQIVAGPIVRYDDVAKELDDRSITIDLIYDGIVRFIIGLSKKVLIANSIGALWTAVKGTDISQVSVVSSWLGILAFTFQIYFDFSGYSDMAIGLGKMMGFHFPENFNYPYLSKSISEFWRRWHITLGSWFKSYVYFPLGGNRKGMPRTIMNLAITWFLTGMEKHSDEARPDKYGNPDYFFGAMHHNMARMGGQSTSISMNELSNHDHSRFLTRTNRTVGRTNTLGPEAANNNINKSVFKEAVVIQMTWPGAPTVYYGDEAGVCGFTDPDNRRTYPWGQEDKELIDFHRAVIRMHKENEVLRTGSYKSLYSAYNVIAYGRFSKDDAAIIIINNNEDEVRAKIPAWEVGLGFDDDVEQLMVTFEGGYSTDRLGYHLQNGWLDIGLRKTSAVVLHKMQW